MRIRYRGRLQSPPSWRRSPSERQTELIAMNSPTTIQVLYPKLCAFFEMHLSRPFLTTESELPSPCLSIHILAESLHHIYQFTCWCQFKISITNYTLPSIPSPSIPDRQPNNHHWIFLPLESRETKALFFVRAHVRKFKSLFFFFML